MESQHWGNWLVCALSEWEMRAPGVSLDTMGGMLMRTNPKPQLSAYPADLRFPLQRVLNSRFSCISFPMPSQISAISTTRPALLSVDYFRQC